MKGSVLEDPITTWQDEERIQNIQHSLDDEYPVDENYFRPHDNKWWWLDPQ